MSLIKLIMHANVGYHTESNNKNYYDSNLVNLYVYILNRERCKCPVTAITNNSGCYKVQILWNLSIRDL